MTGSGVPSEGCTTGQSRAVGAVVPCARTEPGSDKAQKSAQRIASDPTKPETRKKGPLAMTKSLLGLTTLVFSLTACAGDTPPADGEAGASAPPLSIGAGVPYADVEGEVHLRNRSE